MSGIDGKQVDYQQLFYRMNEAFALCEIISGKNEETYDCRFLDVNPAFERLAGMNKEELLGKRCSEVFGKEDLSWMNRCINDTFANGSARIETYLPGLRRHYEVMAYQPSAGQLAAQFADISNKSKLEEKALLESNLCFLAAVDSLPCFFMVFDDKLRFRYANRAVMQIIGLPDEEVYGHTNEEILSPEIISPYIDHLKRALETKSVQRAEYTYDLPSGMMTFSTIYVPVLNELGDVVQILGISHDITERKNAERRLKSIIEENRKQNRLLETVVGEMKGSYDEVERLLYKISHDLMAPLITIEGFLGLLKKDVEKCNRVRIEIDLGLIGDAVSRMRNLLSSSLELSSLGMLSGAAESLSFKDIVEAARKHLNDTGVWSGLVITEDENFPAVYIGRKRMEDVLMSMIEGCIRCSGVRSSPRVHVGWRMDEGNPVFFTRCKGTGDVKDVTEAFRLCCSDQDYADNCTSIGLAISKRIIELQGGRMWMECSSEAGCTILFTLPQR